MIKKNGNEYKVGSLILNNGKKFYPVFQIIHDNSLENERYGYYYPQKKLKTEKWLVFRKIYPELPCEYFETKEEAEKYCTENYSVVEEDVGEEMLEEQLQSNKDTEEVKIKKWWK